MGRPSIARESVSRDSAVIEQIRRNRLDGKRDIVKGCWQRRLREIRVAVLARIRFLLGQQMALADTHTRVPSSRLA